jgi:hypothetical protein
VATFDLRDPGEFSLEILNSWYFGATDPEEQPIPICVGSHIAIHFRKKDGLRARIHAGALIQVSIAESELKETSAQPRFGSSKCDHGDSIGRWINMENAACAPPFCTGDRLTTVNAVDVS